MVVIFIEWIAGIDATEPKVVNLPAASRGVSDIVQEKAQLEGQLKQMHANFSLNNSQASS